MAPVVIQDSVETQTGAISAGQLVPIYSAFQWSPPGALMTPVGSGATATTLPTNIGGPATGNAGLPYAPVQGGYAGIPGPTSIATEATVGLGVGPAAVNASAGVSSTLPGGDIFGVPMVLALAVFGFLFGYLGVWKIIYKGG